MSVAGNDYHEGLIERLRQFDRAVALEYPDTAFELVIVGGSALILLGVLSRPTDDVDAIRFPRQLEALMEAFDLNGRVVAYESHFPYNFEDRLVPVEFEHRAVRCYTASLEDLVVSKLYSPRDIDSVDIRGAAVLDALDWDRLDAAVQEAGLSKIGEQRYRDMLHNYAEYRGECGPCAS